MREVSLKAGIRYRRRDGAPMKLRRVVELVAPRYAADVKFLPARTLTNLADLALHLKALSAGRSTRTSPAADRATA